ncbi:hypothetical protein DevBK_20540 [Devosia sp. BK]|uniref:hypothetical protein n=1 Tax=Devosia sp. BK TaxID=2871706 RepID=UPI00293B7D52|nr:hypothetical protein [Devosia sp. BK]MDV3253736.1 hypothetical protein [Devosia sp. BK]
MTRHELITHQTETPSSRPADNLALVDGRIGIPPRSATSAKESAAPKAFLSHHARQTWPRHRRFKLVPQPAKSRKTHSAQTVAREFGLTGLSGAYRQPKLFKKAVWQLSALRPMKAELFQATA